MKKTDRLNFILEEIRTYNQVKSTDLSEKLNVSEDTVRRYLKELSSEGKIKKVHGGAMASSYIPYSHKEREIYAQEEKVKIVRKARKLLKNKMVIAMDGGTTNLEMARLLPPDMSLSIITNSLPIALQLTDLPCVEVIFLGGKVFKSAQVAIGHEVVNALQNIKADLCFIGTRSIDAGFGMSDIDHEEVQVKKAMIQNSIKSVSLTLSEKVSTTQPYKICPIEDIDIIITELDPGHSLFKTYKEKGVKVM